MRLSKKSLIPLYQQVMDDLKKEIDAGTYAPNKTIPSETELSQIYNVSRITVRRAVEELSDSGYLTKRQGKGTYVNPPKLTRKIWQPRSASKSFTEVCKEDGRVAGARVLSVEISEGRPSELESLRLPESSKLIHVRRVREADGIPVMLENNYFPYTAEFSFLLDANLNDSSLFDLLTLHTKRQIAQTTLHTLEVLRATSEIATDLSLAVGDPVFFERSDYVDQDNQPYMVGRHFIVGALYLFEI